MTIEHYKPRDVTDPLLDPVTRVLLALKPVPNGLDTDTLEQRGIDKHARGMAERRGLVIWVRHGKHTYWRLTEAGRAACPNRRDLHGPAARAQRLEAIDRRYQSAMTADERRERGYVTRTEYRRGLR